MAVSEGTNPDGRLDELGRLGEVEREWSSNSYGYAERSLS
jgi:hypothetical protein